MTQSDTKPTGTLAVALDAIDELKGESVTTLDVSALTTIAEHMVICSGHSARHVKSLANSVTEHSKKIGLQPRVEGLDQADWVLIDLNGVIVHIMQPTARAYFQIEKLWDIDEAATPDADQQSY